MKPHITVPLKTLGISALVGLAFWIAGLSAVLKFGPWRVVQAVLFVVFVVSFGKLVYDVRAAMRDPRRNFKDVDRLAANHWNRREMERRAGKVAS